MEKRIDLHTHSNCSDGSTTPRELLAHAAKMKLAAIALTDHDTVIGLDEAAAAAKAEGIEFVPGVELSTEGICQAHILGYYFDPRSERLQELFAAQQAERKVSNRKYLERLAAHGFVITDAELRALVPHGGIGRAHYAKIMMDKGYVSSVAEAFDKYLGVGKPCYVKREVIHPIDAISVIHDAGGVAFLAHPHQTKLPPDELYAFVKELRDAGLDGLEGYYSEYTPEMGKAFRAMASEFGLALSGGSDYHAEMKPHIELGHGINNNLTVPYQVLTDIKALAGR